MRRSRTGPRKRKDVISWSKVLTDEETKKLMLHLKKGANTVNGKRIYLICDILLNTGLRFLELAKLRVEDTPAVLGVKAIEVYMGKGKKDRTIPISERLTKVINKYIKDVRPKTLPRHIRRSDMSKPLFYSSRYRPYTQTAGDRCRVSVSLYRTIRGLGEEAGIAKVVHPHMFRHTFAVNALRSVEDGGAGVDIYTLQTLMGHSSIEITAKYLHFISGHSGKIGERLDRSFDGFFSN